MLINCILCLSKNKIIAYYYRNAAGTCLSRVMENIFIFGRTINLMFSQQVKVRKFQQKSRYAYGRAKYLYFTSRYPSRGLLWGYFEEMCGAVNLTFKKRIIRKIGIRLYFLLVVISLLSCKLEDFFPQTFFCLRDIWYVFFYYCHLLTEVKNSSLKKYGFIVLSKKVLRIESGVKVCFKISCS